MTRTPFKIWLVVAIMTLALTWALWPTPTAVALGMIGGSIIGANLPERWRKRLVVPRLTLIG